MFKQDVEIFKRDWKFQARLKVSSEIENFKRTSHQTLFIGGGGGNSEGQDSKFKTRL